MNPKCIRLKKKQDRRKQCFHYSSVGSSHRVLVRVCFLFFPYIMDSLAWVKYRQGELQPAADLLKNAFAKAEVGVL